MNFVLQLFAYSSKLHPCINKSKSIRQFSKVFILFLLNINTNCKLWTHSNKTKSLGLIRWMDVVERLELKYICILCLINIDNLCKQPFGVTFICQMATFQTDHTFLLTRLKVKFCNYRWICWFISNKWKCTISKC